MTVAGTLGRAVSLTGFAALAWVAILLELAPLGLRAGAAASPDLLFCVVAAHAMRARDGAPAPLVFALGLARDALAGGALGLGAIALVAASEALRAKAGRERTERRLARWGKAVMWAAIMAAGVWLGLLISLSPTPPLSELALRVGLTALAYPVVALAVRAAGFGRGEAETARSGLGLGGVR